MTRKDRYVSEKKPFDEVWSDYCDWVSTKCYACGDVFSMESFLESECPEPGPAGGVQPDSTF